MVAAPADTDSVFFDHAQARRRLASADNLRLEVPDSRNHRCCRRGDSTKAAQEIQRDPFGGQNTPRWASDGGDHRARRHSRAIDTLGPHLDSRIDQLEGKPSQIDAGDHAGLAGHQKRRGTAIDRHYRVSRQIAGTAEVLEQRHADQRLNHDGWE